MPKWAAIGASISSGLIFGLAQPGWGLWPLGFVFLVPMLGAFHARRWPRRMLLGGLAGAIGTGLSVGGSGANALEAYFGLAGFALGLAWLLALVVLGALPLAVFGLLSVDRTRLGAFSCFAGTGSAWVVGEAFRNVLFPGAWLSLSNSLTGVPALLQSASTIGHFGVAFWIAGMGALIHRFAVGPRRRGAALGLALSILVIGTQATWALRGDLRDGSLQRAKGQEPPPGSLRITLVQSGIDSRESDPIRSDRESLDRLIRLTRSAGPSDLVIWPENAFRSLWPFNHSLLTNGTPAFSFESLLFGAPWVETATSQTELGVAGILVGRDLRIRGHHRKTRLLPLAENRRLNRLLEDFGTVTTNGPGYAAATNASPLEIGETRVGVSLCYEILFSDLARDLTRSGAGILVNLSNESWLGPDTHGPDQMLAAAVLRAIEVRRPVLRSTTIGITAAIDAEGRNIAALPREGEGVLIVDVVPGKAISGFARWGHAPVILVVAAWMIALVTGSVQSTISRRNEASNRSQS